MRFRKRVVTLLVCVGSLITLPAYGACSNASVKGAFGVLSSGLNGSGLPASSVDQVTLDGAGNLSGFSTKSIDGSIITFTFTGTYTVAANCTGTATFNNQDGSIKHDNIFIYNGNRSAYLIQTDAGHVESSVASVEGTATCTNLGVKGSFALEATGQDPGTGQIAAGGRLTLNGTGGITGTMTRSINGAITSSAPTSGTYTINSNCSGTATVTPRGLPAVDLSLLVVNGGKEILFLQTDTGTVVGGTMQQ